MAYLNARNRALAFVRSIAGFPLKRGWVYKVNNALYGLHESGREWYDELYGWPSSKGLQRSLTEPCLYYFFDGDTTPLVLVYVDDIICATIKESWKTQFFADRRAKYGIKDLGRLSNMAQQTRVNLWKVSGEMNPADLLTKPMGVTRLRKMKSLIGIQPDTYQTHREMKPQNYRTGAEMRSDQAARSE
ncbi:hypothetical protein PC123_g26089 [Phytophthora cactorum]|nr:hypothetical protein PC123_g26089 [Phytophthora cactorum]